MHELLMPDFCNQESFRVIYDIDSIGTSIHRNIGLSWVHGDEADLMVRIGCVDSVSYTMMIVANESGIFVFLQLRLRLL
jgi:hypothetical protein